VASGAVPAYAAEMASTLRALTVLASDPDALASFWGDLLGWDRVGLELLPDAQAPLRLAFKRADLPHDLLNQIHFHLTSYTASQDGHVERALSLGASHLDVGQLPEEDHVVLADPEGNEFCIIEETNNWLAGTGFLGEIAADGTREVGVFWAAALDWPLVHDEDGETAISPPEGGFKIAWGGEPLNERAPHNRMYFVLVTDDLDADIDRLVGLGASLVERRADEVEMADPDGNEFVLRAGWGR
jgi:predicted enzyme related to lactoylglutathione lyase